MRRRGRLVALEGGEAAGKSTQSALLASALGAVATREPGATSAGRRLRDLLLDPGAGGLSARAEALLMAADRAEHVDRVLEPALASGRWVVTDRFSGSFLAYQGYGRGLDLDELRRLSHWASRGLTADLNVLLELPPSVAAGRRVAPPDRFEMEDGGFHGRVAAGYRELAAEDPKRWAVVDAAGHPDEVARRIAAVVSERLGATRG